MSPPLLPPPPPPSAGLASPPSPFDFASTATSVHTSMDEALAAIPAGHDAAVLLKGTVQEGQPAVQLMSAQKFGSNWALAEGAIWSGGSHVDGEIALVGSWSWH